VRETGPAPSRQRYILILILFLHTVNTYMDRACISAAGNDIQRDLAIPDQTLGYIFAVFALGYALFQIPAGWISDVLGPRKVLALVVTAWSAFTMLTGTAFNTLSMLIVRFLFGAGEAGAFPGATRALYDWLPVRERGIAQGIFHSGARVGAALSLFLMPFLIGRIGWRLMFAANGLVGVAWAALWWIWFRDRPEDHPSVNAAELASMERGAAENPQVSRKIPFLQIATSSNMFLAMFQYVASNVTFFISFTWLLPYLEDRWGEEARMYAPLPLISGMLAHWTSGFLVTYLYKLGFPAGSRRIPAIVGFLLGAAGLLLTTRTDSPASFVLLFSVAVFGVEMTISPSWSFCMDIGGERTGAVSGSMNMLGNMGSALSAILFPYFRNNVTIPFLADEAGTANSFFVFAAGMNLAAAFAWLLMNPGRKLSGEVSKRQVLLKAMLFLGILIALVALLVYKLFFLE